MLPPSNNEELVFSNLLLKKLLVELSLCMKNFIPEGEYFWKGEKGNSALSESVCVNHKWRVKGCN